MIPDVPQGATEQSEGNEPGETTSDPEQCVDLMFGGAAAEKYERMDPAEGSVYWQSGEGADLVGTRVLVRSYPSEVGPEAFAAAGEALGACDNFDYQGEDSSGSFNYDLSASSRPSRNFGEQTISLRFATRIDVGGELTPYHLDFLRYRVGHNVVTVRETHFDKDRGTDDMEQLAGQVMEDLQE